MKPIREKLGDGTKLTIVVKQSTEEVLCGKCFRENGLPKAGNFLHWDSAWEFFHNNTNLDEFIAEIEMLWKEGSIGIHSLNITHNAPVGWSSTDKLKNYSSDCLERFRINRKAYGSRVKSDYDFMPAPLTNCLTIVYELKVEHGLPVVIFISTYPGDDIGELIGEVSEREGVVFFDWEHPGEDIV